MGPKANTKHWINPIRMGSIALFGISLILLAYIAKVGIDFSKALQQQTELLALKAQMLEQKENLEEYYTKLGDSHYYAIFVKDNHQYNGDSIIIFPED